MPATLRQIAAQTGVSISTVSRVLNGFSGVRDEVRDRVLEVAAELDYTPNAAARTLVLQSSRLIAVVIRTGDDREFQHPFYQVVLDGVKNAAALAGYDISILSHEGRVYGDDSEYFVTRVRRQQAAGTILMGVRDADIALLAKFRIPVMTVDFEPRSPIEGQIGMVASNSVAGTELAMRHLYEIGRRRIAHIAGMLNTSAGERRLEGYRKMLGEFGLPFREDYVAEGDWLYPSGSVAMRQLLELPEPPDAVFAAGDMMALGAMRAARDLGVNVPDDLAVVGFDDILFASLSTPTLTTIRQDKDKLGMKACELLIELLERRTTVLPKVLLPVELIVRESTGGEAVAGDTFGIGLDALLGR